MGIDWEPMKPKRGTDLDELRRLIREQAVAFQSMYGWNPTSDQDPLCYELQCHLHSTAYRTASDAIRSRIDIPRWDEERGVLTEYPDLQPSWRIYPISKFPIFPPLVRVQAGRTILPDELPGQLDAWKQWVEGVTRGDHDHYLRELHWYETADWARYHWTALRDQADASLSASGKWASRPELDVLREEILRLPQPVVPQIRLSPSEDSTFSEQDFAVAYPYTLNAARTLVALTRRWDGFVRGNRKVRYYEDCYKLTLDEFRTWAADPWLHEFFAWAERCVDLGFGLRLDY